MVMPITLAKRFRKRPNGFFRVREGLEVLKDDKMCTVREVSERDGLGHVTDLIVFPLNDEHIRSFKQAAKGVRAHGPAMSNPGAVGTVSLRKTDGGPYFFDYAQAHYTTGRNGEKNPKILPRSLATKYGGWRQRAFRFATQIASDENRDIVVPHSMFLSNQKEPHETQMYKDLKRVCDEEGFEITKSTRYAVPAFVIRPKNDAF